VTATDSTVFVVEIQKLLADKDAEIGRLARVVEELSDHGVAAERMALLKRQQEEIERLSVEIFDQREQRFWMQQRLSVLLRRAADALEKVHKEWPIEELGLSPEIITELREAVK
jgi:hypothetical protein